MKKLSFLLICIGLFQVSIAQMNPSVPRGPEGFWKCSAPDAPYQYKSFNIQIDKAIDLYSGKILADGGVEIPINSFNLKDSTIEMGLFVEGTSVTIKLKYDGSSLKGTATSDQGDIGITAERVEVTEMKTAVPDSTATPKNQ